MASTLTSFDEFLKDNYTKDEIDNLTKKNRPLWGKITMEPDHSGRQYVHPVIYTNPQGLGPTLAKAQAGATQSNGGNLKGKDWNVSYGDYDGVVEIGDKTIKASRNNVGAFLRNQTVEIDGLYNAFADTFATYLYSNGGRSLGSFTISSGVCTLVNADDIVNFEEGQILVVSANDGSDSSHTLIASSAAGYVIAVNRNAGTFTVSATSGGSAGTPTNWSGTMFAFRDGDFGGSGATRSILGLGAWIPSSDPSATAFEGVVRTADVTRLSGVRLTSTEISGLGLEQRLKKLVTRMTGRNHGPGPTDIFMNTEKWQALADSLESRGKREIGGDAKFNYSSIKLVMGGKTVEIWGDSFCPINTAWALHMPSIKLASYDKIPHVLNGDGLEMLRKTSSNDYEHRIVAYPAFAVVAPGWCGRVALN